MGGGLLAYGFHYHLHCLNPGRMGVGWGGWGVDSIRFPLPFALSTPWKTGWGGVGGGLIAYGCHFHLHCLHPGRLGVGWGGWGVDNKNKNNNNNNNNNNCSCCCCCRFFFQKTSKYKKKQQHAQQKKRNQNKTHQNNK